MLELMTKNSSISGLSLENFHSVTMTLDERGWWDSVPSEHGWYMIETDAPLSVIENVPTPKRDSKHYHIAKRSKNAQFLISNRLAILPASEGALFVVYSGEHGNLKSRAREHTHGANGTACMCLSQYESLWKHQWWFHYRTCEDHAPNSSGNKVLRTFLEQKWRGEYGWPILCAQ